MNEDDKYLNEQIIIFLKKINIQIFNNDLNSLDGQLISRDTLLNDITYKNIQEDIPILKNIFSSSTLTSLQKNAKDNQKWPLLNIVRQILKQKNFKMIPIRKCNGRTKEGKKKFIRFFQIQKLKNINEQNL